MTATPTGRRESRHGHDSIVLDRTFRAPVESVWATITESDRLARWFGTWTGDPSSGSVQLRMNAEGDEVAAETFTIDACDPPRHLALTSSPAGEGPSWVFALDLVEVDGSTTLTFSQSVPDATWAGSVGPGWEWYLDRLVAAETGGDVAALDFGDYHPALEEHYQEMFRD